MKNYLNDVQTNCPRCLIPWQSKTNDHTCQCGMLIAEIHESEIIALKIKFTNEINDQYIIYWNDDGFGYYFIVNENQNLLGGATYAWLPYDITLQQLKLYITFS